VAWVDTMMIVNRRMVALGFLRSAEYRGDMVQAYHAGLLHRSTPASVAEVTGWVETGADQTAVRAGFLLSSEFTLNG
jgi:hypothetical protein